MIQLTLFLLASFLLLHEENKDFSEDLDEVYEKVQRVGNEVSVTLASLDNDELSVIHNEPTEDGESQVNVNLKQKLRPKENVEESEEQQ